MKKINQLDLFSGIGGFHLGFEQAGFKVKSYFSEVDPHAIAVYKHKFKNSTYVGSVTDVRGEELPKIHLITFGSPCQDFSIAGNRKGMEGDRSSLILEAIRLITECRPRVFIWENVKGTFSSNSGQDFAAIIQEFTNIGGYRLEWQLLNSAWFLPQNRERVYLVGYLDAPKRNWRGIFPITGDNPQHRTMESSRKAIAKCLTARGQADLHSGLQLIKEPIKVKSANSRGYDEAYIGDSINLTAINSTTRRGRVGEKKAQTLDTKCEQAVIEVESERIRRLHPIETERLQGFPDNHTQYGEYDGVVKLMSNSQRYKQCGNAVTVNVVQAIAERLKPIFKFK
tara:strand:- start:2914 stop:3933 length:1020 start_codon:yes stop_codon:yes gene_type:complete